MGNVELMLRESPDWLRRCGSQEEFGRAWDAVKRVYVEAGSGLGDEFARRAKYLLDRGLEGLEKAAGKLAGMGKREANLYLHEIRPVVDSYKEFEEYAKKHFDAL